MNREVKSLFDAAVLMDNAHAELCQIFDAMQLLDEGMEDEGFQPEDKLEEWRAVNFVKRFPLYLSLFRVICQDLHRVINEMQVGSDLIYAASRKEKNVT